MKYYLSICLCIVVFSLQTNGKLMKTLFEDADNFQFGPERISRITNGRIAVPHSYPWLVSLQVRIDENHASHFCGGALVAPEWVLTAAHCVLSVPGLEIDAVLGAHDLTKSEGTEQRIPVEKLLLENKYNDKTVNNDVGLLKLSQPAVLDNNVKTLDIATDSDAVPNDCIASGWGSETIDGYPSHVLQETDVNILSNDQCQDIWLNQDITNAMLCAGSGTSGICAGDSGSPLICREGNKWLAYGISSWGAEKCGLQDVPDVYTRVSTFYDVIKNVVNGNGDYVDDGDDDDDDDDDGAENTGEARMVPVEQWL